MRYLKILPFLLFFSTSFSHEIFEVPSDVRMTLIDHENGQINVYTYDEVFTLNYSLELLNTKKIIADDKFFESPFFIMFPFEIEGVTYASLNGRSDIFVIDDNTISRLPSNYDFLNHFSGASIFKFDNKIVKYGGYAFWNYFDQFIYYDFGLNSWELLAGRPVENNILGSESHVLLPINDQEVIIFSGYTDSSLSQFLNVYKFNFSENEFTLLGETNFDKFNRYSNKIDDKNYLLFENLSQDSSKYAVIGSDAYTEVSILNTSTFFVYKVDELPIHQYILPQNGVFFYDTDFHKNYPDGNIFLNGQKSTFANTILFYTYRDGKTTLHSYPTIEILRNSRFDDKLFTKEYPYGFLLEKYPILSRIVIIYIILEVIRFIFFRNFKYKLTFFNQSMPTSTIEHELLLINNGITFGFQNQGKFYPLSEKCYNILIEIRRNKLITNEKLEEIVFEDELSRSTNFRNKSKKLEQLELKIQSATNIDNKIIIQVKSEFDSRFIDYKIIDSISIV